VTDAYIYWVQRLPKRFSQPLRTVEPIAGRHTVARLTDAEGKVWVGKVNEGNSNKHEVFVLERLLKEVGCREHVPEYLFDNEEPEILLTQKLDGSHVATEVMLNYLQPLLQVLTDIHQTTANLTEVMINYESLFRELPRHPLRNWLEREANKALVVQASAITGFVHGDLVPQNLILNDEHWSLIDWEYSHYGDVRWDLASLAVEFGLTVEQFYDVCRSYCLLINCDMDHFLSSAKLWLVIYIRICLGWSNTNNQPEDKYWLYLEMNLLN